jgi:glycosyltransferase involved in cell wall biosynthesis
VQNHIRKAHVCLFPTFAETLGMVTIESMALQKPVVNSNIGWANELIEDGISGYLVHPQNHDLFAERIIALLNNPEWCREMGKTARRRVEEKFDIQKAVQQNIQFYQGIAKR